MDGEGILLLCKLLDGVLAVDLARTVLDVELDLCNSTRLWLVVAVVGVAVVVVVAIGSPLWL